MVRGVGLGLGVAVAVLVMGGAGRRVAGMRLGTAGPERGGSPPPACGRRAGSRGDGGRCALRLPLGDHLGRDRRGGGRGGRRPHRRGVEVGGGGGGGGGRRRSPGLPLLLLRGSGCGSCGGGGGRGGGGVGEGGKDIGRSASPAAAAAAVRGEPLLASRGCLPLGVRPPGRLGGLGLLEHGDGLGPAQGGRLLPQLLLLLLLLLLGGACQDCRRSRHQLLARGLRLHLRPWGLVEEVGERGQGTSPRLLGLRLMLRLMLRGRRKGRPREEGRHGRHLVEAGSRADLRMVGLLDLVDLLGMLLLQELHQPRHLRRLRLRLRRRGLRGGGGLGGGLDLDLGLGLDLDLLQEGQGGSLRPHGEQGAAGLRLRLWLRMGGEGRRRHRRHCTGTDTDTGRAAAAAAAAAAGGTAEALLGRTGGGAGGLGLGLLLPGGRHAF